VAGALSLSTLAALHGSYPALYARLTGRALPLVILAAASGLAVLILLSVGRLTGVRVVAALGVAAVIWGWGVAQYPVVLPATRITLASAGAPHSTLVAVVVVFIAAVLLIGPSFALLFLLQGRRLLRAEHAHGALSTGPSAASHPRGEHEPAPRRPAGGPSVGGRTPAEGVAAAVAFVRALASRHRNRRKS
jgi:hypothetical protein